jgi:CubicO group peptidase (beta-lactamase class C family)
MVLGYVVEKVSGKPLNVYIDEKLYKKLNLPNTLFKPGKIKKTNIAATSHGNPFEKRMVEDDTFGFACDENPTDFKSWRQYSLIGEVNDGNSFYAHNGVAGHAGLFSTAEDLLELINIILNKGKYGNTRIIKEKTINEFIKKDRFGNGLGWALSPRIIYTDSFKDVEAFGHTGFTGTFVLGVPKIRLAIILLTNRQNVGVNEKGSYYNLKTLRKGIVDIVLKEYADVLKP